ncbi:MAG: GntR family transcriptional regulator [Nevskia sp.]|nr:GntR family transcriptional regulator [Nevskia sp.]
MPRTPKASNPQPTPIGADRSLFVRAKKVPELMASDIRKRIVRGDLREGDTLPPEAELMIQYSVSRPTLREALRILESESLIVIRRGGIGGAMVMRPMLDATARHFGMILQDRGATVQDVYKARMVIEPPAMADLARAATKAQVAEIKKRLDAAEELVGSSAKYAHAITEIREYMISLAGNITVSLLTRLVDEILERYSARIGEARGEEWAQLQRKSQRSLRKLVGLVEAKDFVGAEKYWRTHLQEAANYLLSTGSATTILDLFD